MGMIGALVLHDPLRETEDLENSSGEPNEAGDLIRWNYLFSVPSSRSGLSPWSHTGFYGHSMMLKGLFQNLLGSGYYGRFHGSVCWGSSVHFLVSL